MRELHLFAGCGGGILGGILCGHTPVCAVELDPYCRQVLLQRQRDGLLPKFPIWDNVQTFNGKNWRGRVDVVCGGFPCQDISIAGNGDGIDGQRSGLWNEMVRVICEIRPAYVFVENSPALTFRGLGRILGDLAGMGFDAQWGVLSAAGVGAAHVRRRLWIIAYTNHHGRNHSRGADFQDSHTPIRPKRPTEAIPARWQKWISRSGEALSAINGGVITTDRIRELDDVAGRVERLKAIGNGQVPAVVKQAWKLLSNENEHA